MMMEKNQELENNECSESPVSSPVGTVLNAPKFGIVIPNRVFVGGISSQTTESDLAQLFSSYGNVVSTKIISDRAGVSKGYGFVTFETDEEAKRLQNDADSIVLRERRLNIAPAIKKQNFQRPYDGVPAVSGSPGPMSSGQMYRQQGVPFFQNGMAFYAPVGPPTPQPPQPMTPVQSPVEAPHVYPPGAYGGVAQNTSAPYTFSYPNPIYYQTPYPYQLALEGYPVTEGTHVGPNNVIISGGGADGGGVVFAASPYIFAQPPGTQQTQYFDTPNMSSMPSAPGQEPSQIYYPNTRGYEPPTFVYTENHGQHPASNASPPSLLSLPPAPMSERKDNNSGNPPRQEPPNFPLHRQEGGSLRGRPPRGRGRGSGPNRGGFTDLLPLIPDFPKSLNFNNNDPKCSNRNPSYPKMTYTNRKVFGYYPPRSDARHPVNRPFFSNPSQVAPSSQRQNPPNSSNRSSPQVPALPYIPGMRPPYGILPISPHFSSPRRGGGICRGKYAGRGGKPMKGQPWSYREANDNADEGGALASALTPPITPRSPHDHSEDLSASLQGLNI